MTESLPRGPPPNTITLGVNMSMYAKIEATHICVMVLTSSKTLFSGGRPEFLFLMHTGSLKVGHPVPLMH